MIESSVVAYIALDPSPFPLSLVSGTSYARVSPLCFCRGVYCVILSSAGILTTRDIMAADGEEGVEYEIDIVEHSCWFGLFHDGGFKALSNFK